MRADATVGAFVMAFLTPVFDTPIRDPAETRDNLVEYGARLRSRYFPALG